MSEITNERVILSALIQNEEFGRKVEAFLSEAYFHDESEKTVLRHIKSFVEKYHNPPTKADLSVSLKNDTEITEKTTEGAIKVVEDIFDISPSNNTTFLIETAEAFCSDKAMFNAIQEAIVIYKGESKSTIHAIPDILKNAMAVSFDTSIGQEYLDDAEKRWDYYKNPLNKIAFDIEAFNKATNGGVTRKTLNLLAAGINVGKTATLISMAAMYMRMGLNVFYVSSEQREEEILNRVDANMMNTPVNDIRGLEKESFFNRIESMKAKSYGKLIVKEYPTGTTTAGKIRHDLNEIKIKKKLKIDIVVMDYIQIMTSSNLKVGINSYEKFKAVAEELRGLMMEEDCIGWTAAQFNRGGLGNTDPKMSDIGESTAIAATVDGMWALIRTEELDDVGQILVSELKSRYGNKSTPVFNVGINIDTQKLYDAPGTEEKFKTSNPTKRRNETKEMGDNPTRNKVNQKPIGNKFRQLKVSNENE